MDNINDEFSILGTLGTFKIKFQILDNLDLKNIDALHIDVNSIISSLYKMKNMFTSDSDYIFEISSSILNLAAHFRLYFVKNNLNVPIYIYYMGESDNSSHITNSISKAIELTSIVTKYIPKVYTISDSFNCDELEMCSIINYFCKKFKNNLIITKNKMFYQLVNKKSRILRPKRDESYIIDVDNLYSSLEGSDKFYNISHHLLPVLYMYTGIDTYKGLKGYGMKKSINHLSSLISKGKIVNEYYSNIDNYMKDSDDKFQEPDMYTKINLRSHFKEISKGVFKLYDDMIIDKFSKNDLRDLNNKYYTGFNSLMLQELLLEPKQPNMDNKINW